VHNACRAAARYLSGTGPAGVDLSREPV